MFRSGVSGLAIEGRSSRRRWPRRRQNVLTRALQEYGRLNKTISSYTTYRDEPFQRRIGAQIKKGEALHALRGLLFVANEGILAFGFGQRL
jgi:TnpA family transposase